MEKNGSRSLDGEAAKKKGTAHRGGGAQKSPREGRKLPGKSHSKLVGFEFHERGAKSALAIKSAGQPTSHSCASCGSIARARGEAGEAERGDGQARSLRETDACRTRFEMQGEV